MNKERVNIQYSIDLQELPLESSRLLKRASLLAEQDLSECLTGLCAKKEEEVLSLNTLSSIDIARKKLAAIDYALSDVSDIINGFLHFQVQQNLQDKFDNQPTARPPMPDPAVRAPEETSDET